MPRNLRKRKAETTGAEEATSTSNVGLSVRSGYKQHRCLEDLPVPPPSFPDHIRLRFEHGASIVFKVLYATATVNGESAFSVDEKVANIYNATQILHEAQEVLPGDPNQTISVDDVKQLETALNALKRDRVFEHHVREKLRSYQERPAWVWNNLELERWYGDACTLLKHSEALKSIFDINEDLKTTLEIVDDHYHQGLEVVKMADTSTSLKPPMKEHATDSYLTRVIGRTLSALREGDAKCKGSTCRKFLHIYRSYETLYDIIRTDQGATFEDYSLSDFADAFRSITRQLVVLLAESKDGESLKDQYLDRALDVFTQGCCHALVSCGQAPIGSRLMEAFAHLENQVFQEHIDMSLETEFSGIAELISSFASLTPSGIAESEWIRYAPRMLSLNLSDNLMKQLQYLYTSYQDCVYNVSELSRLWLNIWRGLKAMYLSLRKNDSNLSLVGFPVEAAYFKRQTVRNQFELVLSGPEALHPEVVENIVAQYCIIIEEARKSANSEIGMLRQFQHSKSISDPVFKTIQKFLTTHKWDDLAVRGIQKCVVRLNFIVDGPAFIRRRNHQYMAPEVRFASDWVFDKVALSSDTPFSSEPLPWSLITPPSTTQSVLSSKLSSAKPTAPATSSSSRLSNSSILRNTRRWSNNTAINRSVSVNDHIDTEMDNEDAMLGVMHAVSAYDYVTYPFPETRAIEVAQSRQIEREMSSSGIYSPGALAQDVVNRPPRHTWPPGVVSIWGKPLPVDPFSILKNVWSEWRRDRSEIRPFQQARSFPRITPRTPRKDWVDQHPRLRPLLDRRTRISKKAAKARQVHKHDRNHLRHHQYGYRRNPQFGPVPKLRGGGASPRINDQSTNTNTDLHTPNANFISVTEQQTRLQQLLDRMQGLWRHGIVPPVGMVRDQFLAPRNWDVNSAYEAARRFAEQVMIDSSDAEGGPSIPGGSQAINRPSTPQFSSLSNASSQSDPFVEAVTNPRLRQNLATHGMRMSGVKRIPPGRQGYRPLPTSPTPPSGRFTASRQTPYANQMLPAHLAPYQDGQFQIREDTPGRPTPAITRRFLSYNTPAPNQEHQAQLDRLLEGFPSHSRDADLENTTPQVQTRVPLGNMRALPCLKATATTIGCNSQICHPCPVYSGLFHHVCTSQLNLPKQTPPGQRAGPDVDADLGAATSSRSSALFTSFGINNTTASWRPQASQVTSSFRVRPAVNDDNPSPLLSVDENDRPRPLRFSYVTPNAATQNKAVSSTADTSAPTQVAGYNLRSRSRLTQQHADTEIRDQDDDLPRPPVTTAQDIRRISNDVSSAIADAVNTLQESAVANATSNLNGENKTNAKENTSKLSDASSDASSSSDSDFDCILDSPPPATRVSGRARARARGGLRGTPLVRATSAARARTARSTPARSTAGVNRGSAPKTPISRRGKAGRSTLVSKSVGSRAASVTAKAEIAAQSDASYHDDDASSGYGSGSSNNEGQDEAFVVPAIQRSGRGRASRASGRGKA